MYIGQSIDPHHRFIQHISRANRNEDDSPLHLAMQEYGRDNFKLEILEWCNNYNQKEKELIAKYNTIIPNGYNIARGGEDPPHYCGENHPKHIITDKDVDKIIDLLKNSDLTEPEIGKCFDPPLNQVMINSINQGKTHRRTNEKYPIRTDCPYHLTEKELEEIKWLIQNTLYPFHQISNHYHVNASAIKNINAGRSYHEDGVEYPLRKFRGQKQSEPVETILAKRSTSAIDTQTEMGICP